MTPLKYAESKFKYKLNNERSRKTLLLSTTATLFYSQLHCEVTALFGEIKPDGNNFFIPKQSSDGHLHSVVESWSGAQ